MTRRPTARLAALLLALAMGVAQPAVAQGLFAPAARVNDITVTNYQVDQRAAFLGLLRAPGADRDSAREALIDETLQVQAARAAGIELTPEQLDEGMVEFAGRANLSPDEFIAALEQAGVAGETFRDFVRNGLYWRGLIRQRFGARARPSEDEIERTLTRGDAGANVSVSLSEIAIPLTPETQDEVLALARRLSDTVRGEAAFAQAARTYSRSQTARAGGRVPRPIPLSGLSPQIATAVLTLAPGEVSEPVNLGSFVGLFLLRGLIEGQAQAPEALSIDYAEYLIPGGRSAEGLARARALRGRVDVCDDLYAVAKGQPEGVLTRATVPVTQLPGDLRQELAKLDEGEVSTLLTSGPNLRFVMLCARVTETPEGAFEALGQQILSRRLEGYAQAYMDELRADAIIVE